MSNQNIISKITTPYAEALLEISQNANLLQETNKNLSSISVILSQSKDLRLLLLNPLINISVKKQILKTLFMDKVNKFVLNFLFVLVDKRRIVFLSEIIEKYLELVYKLESITVAELSSAVDLSENQQKDLIEKIKLITCSTNVKLITNTDPALIGGFRVKIGSKVIDTSLAGKLKSMSLYLKTN